MIQLIKNLLLLNRRNNSQNSGAGYPTPGVGEHFNVTSQANVTLSKVNYINAYNGTEKFRTTADAIVTLSKI